MKLLFILYKIIPHEIDICLLNRDTTSNAFCNRTLGLGLVLKKKINLGIFFFLDKSKLIYVIKSLLLGHIHQRALDWGIIYKGPSRYLKFIQYFPRKYNTWDQKKF